MNYQLRYIFQGLTADGQTLISASYPITTTLLPDNTEAMTEDEVIAFEEDPQAYLEATASALTFLAPTDFNPSLDALDAMIQSLSIARVRGDRQRTGHPDGDCAVDSNSAGEP